MLVTRQCDTGRYNWSPPKLGTLHQKSASPRMSNLEQLTTQPDWREQYSQYLPTADNTANSPAFDQSLGPQTNENQQYGVRPQPEQRHTLAQLDTRRDVSQTLIERPDSAPGNVPRTTNDQEQLVVMERNPLSHASVPMRSASPATLVKTEMSGHAESDVQQVLPKEENEEDDEDDEDMLDTDEMGGPPQTEAERRAERRKMKRFRLTHQQTRFLMSEFAKQAHPDAAHRDRLSKEIPGLSPRQVQVWFQNRRAKIKRLTADDRDRMMKMRAVPDDFDNIQALHSPYGAVHGVGTPIVSPIDYQPSYGDHGMRPLMVDTMRRHESDDHISPTGLTPGFGHVGFAPSGSLGTPDVLSPLSLTSSDRYYGSHLSSPLSAGPRSSNPFNRQNSSDSYQMHPHARQNPRPLQPIQLRETMSRSRSESLQSPLRSSMSWKGDSLDYAEYAHGQTSPGSSGRQQSQYQPQQQSSNPVNVHQYDADAYSNQPQPQISYPSSQPPSHSLQSSSATVPRFRAASSAYPSGLDLRSQYRTIPSQHPGPHAAPPGTPRTAGFVSSFSNTGFQSAPLTSPPEFQVPRTPIDAGPRDYHMSQLNAPMAQSQDFVSAYSHGVGISPNRAAPAERSALQGQSGGGHESQSAVQEQPQQVDPQTGSYLPRESQSDYEAQKRKRAYSMGGGYEGHHP